MANNTVGVRNIEAEIAEVIACPTTSDWLRQCLELALARDCVDAANDAEHLSQLLTRRCDILINR